MDGQLDLAEVRRRFDECVTEDFENREEALDDMEFLAGRQWPETVKAEREADSRPILTINRMPQFVRQVTGDIRQANPAIKVEPGDDEASDDMADFLAGKIRQIEYECDGSSVYERAAESAASCGMGHWRALLDRDDRNRPKAKLESIFNPFAVHWDPLAKDPTRKDARFCFVTDEMGLEDFRNTYPDADASAFEGDGTVEHLRSWVTGEYITIAEYFEKGRHEGQPVVWWYKISGVEILEGPIALPTRHIPVFPVVGEETHIGNKTVRTSVIRYAKDSQRRYNYWTSAHTEIVALQPKAPWLVTAKQISGHEGYWNNANVENLPYLPYNPDEKAPPPQRQTPPVQASGMMQEIMLAADDMKATTGIFDAGLGAQGNEKSGIAIQRRQQESDISTSIYVDNLGKSIAQCGRVLVEFIQRAYDQTRSERVIGVDGKPSVVELNRPVMGEFGPEYENNPAVGVYDVRVSTGPSYSTQRAEAADSMTQFVQAYPQAAPAIMDLVAKNMDWPGADEIAERLEALAPPGMIQKDPEEMTPQERQAFAQQQQMAQMQQQIAQMQQELQMRAMAAETQQAEADAQKALHEAEGEKFETADKQLELLAKSGQLDAAITQLVNEAVARALMGRTPVY